MLIPLPFAARVAFGSSSVIIMTEDSRNFDAKLQARLSDPAWNCGNRCNPHRAQLSKVGQLPVQ